MTIFLSENCPGKQGFTTWRFTIKRSEFWKNYKNWWRSKKSLVQSFEILPLSSEGCSSILHEAWQPNIRFLNYILCWGTRMGTSDLWRCAMTFWKKRANNICPKAVCGGLFCDDSHRGQWYSCPATDTSNGGSSERSSEGWEPVEQTNQLPIQKSPCLGE